MSSVSKFASHDPKVISVFEVLGSYFVDVFFNHLHHSAKTSTSRGSSVTDEYVRRVQAFVIGVKTDKSCYGRVIQVVHEYFKTTTRYTALSFSAFVDRIVSVCIPEQYFSGFTADEKDEILSSVICDLVSNLASFATKPDVLHKVIDQHTVAPGVTVRMLQDAAVNALISKRAALQNKFLRKMGQARDHVSMDVIEDMKKALRRLVKEKVEATSRADEAEEEVDSLKSQLKKFKVREAKMHKLINLLRRGHEEGEAATGASLSIPRQNQIAEPDPLDIVEGEVPDRERIAETKPDSDSEDESDSDSESEDDRPRRRAKRSKHRSSHRKTAVSASFFKTGGQSAPVQASAPPQQNVFAGVVSTTPADDDLDSILYGDD